MELKYIAVDAGSADHPMNTKIRDWEPLEAERCDAFMRSAMAKDSMRSTNGPIRIKRCTSGLPAALEIIHVECLGGEIDIVPKNKRMILGTFRGSSSMVNRPSAAASHSTRWSNLDRG